MTVKKGQEQFSLLLLYFLISSDVEYFIKFSSSRLKIFLCVVNCTPSFLLLVFEAFARIVSSVLYVDDIVPKRKDGVAKVRRSNEDGIK